MKKKVYLICLFVSLTTSSMVAQESQVQKKNEVRVGIGFLSTNEFIDSYSDIASIGLTAGMYSSSNQKTSGDYSLSYRYALKERLSIGASFVFNTLSEDLSYNNNYAGKSKNNYFTIAPEVEFRYINSPFFKMYGFVGGGLTINNQESTTFGETSTSNTPFFNFQISPLCAQVGDRFGLYVEAGFGYKGIVNLGLFAKF